MRLFVNNADAIYRIVLPQLLDSLVQIRRRKRSADSFKHRSHNYRFVGDFLRADIASPTKMRSEIFLEDYDPNHRGALRVFKTKRPEESQLCILIRVG